MTQKTKTILAIVFFPITIAVFVVSIVKGKKEEREIHEFLENIQLSDIDAINGYQFEEIIDYLFRYYGYKTSITKKSGDYGVDVFASRKQENYCIQAKLYYNHSVGASAIQQINTAKNYYGCDYSVVITNSRYSKQAVDMARKLNVILLDRDDLGAMLQQYKDCNKKFLINLLEEKKCLKRS